MLQPCGLEYRPLRNFTIGRRLIALLVYASLLALFALDPTAWLGEEGYVALSMAAQLGGPLLASIVCLLAARRSVGTDRRAWVSFTIGSALYFAGNILYFGLLAAGYVPSFPSLPEAAYFIMALFFAVGMFQYVNVGPQIKRLQVYNFILVF